MLLKTGFGVFIKNGKKLRKFILTPGEHPDPIGYTYQEVNSQEELDKIVLDKSDEQVEFERKENVRQSLITSGKAKLKQSGLSDDELNALFGV